jgi:hypothetical protein
VFFKDFPALTLEALTIVVCIALLLRSLVSSFQARRSLQWWYRKQALILRQEAEEIRNGLLQDSFSLRRNLEICSAAPEGDRKDLYLDRIEKLYAELKDLSDRLSPPFIDESFPHAVKSILDRWQVRYPELGMTLELPETWCDDSYENCRAILMMVEELLTILLEGAAIESLAVRLQPQNQKGQLILEFTQASASDNINATDLNHLKSVFQSLTTGTCFYRYRDSTMTWYFHWHLSESLNKNL